MNSKMIGIVVLVLVVLGGGYLLMNKNTSQQATNTAMVEEGSENTADVVVEETSDSGDQAAGQEAAAEETGDDAMAAKAKEFTVEGNNFSFDVKEIKVKKGDTVKIVFNNKEGFHDWVLDEFDAKTKQIKEGESETIEFVADKAGTYEYYCSVGKHRANGMLENLLWNKV